MILPPQISANLLPELAAALEVEVCRFVDLGIEGASLASSTLARGFLKTQVGGQPARGEMALMISVGSGLQVAAATYFF